MQNIIKAIGEYWSGSDLLALLFIISVFVEFSPIKINPIQWITSLFYRGITDNLFRKLDEIKTETAEKIDITTGKIEEVQSEVHEFEERIDMIEINNMRTAILNFANSCMKKEKHNREEFAHILSMCDRYESVIRKSGFCNGQMEVSIRYIKDTYGRCLKEGGFL